MEWPHQELLYSLFERRLYSVPEAEEPMEFFVEMVVQEYLAHQAKQGFCIPAGRRHLVEEELREDVMEMTRKKIYGHVSLNEFRAKSLKFIQDFRRKNA